MVDDLRFWAGTAWTASFEGRLRAARAGGFDSVSAFPSDCPSVPRARRLREAADACGIRIATLDPYARWLPRWEPPATISAERLKLVDTGESAFFAAAEALGAESLTATEPFGVRYQTEELIESVAALCDRAADSGLRAHLEFTPFGGIADLDRAWEVVSGADRANGGLVFDTWHYLRGRPDPELLERIPGDRVFVVQVSDAAARPQGSLIEDTMRHRRLPGEGDWDLAGVLAPLLRKTGIGSIGAEVLSEELWRRPAEEIGRLAGDSLRSVLSAARRSA